MKKLIQVLPDVLIVVGVISVAVGAGLVYVPAGYIVGGLFAIGMGAVVGNKLESKAGE